MAREYATATQVQQLVGIPDVAAGTLRRASRAVDRILKGAHYDVDEHGMPTNPDVAALLTEMVAEQVAWFQELGDETGIAAAGGGSIGSVSLPTIGGGRQTAADALLAPNAVALARSSDLLEWRVLH